jgi:RNA processing factor Prp31
MGIDIYARWPEQDKDALEAQISAWGSTDSGDIGYIREAYHGEPYPSQHLMPEAFDNDEGVVIPVAILHERLPETLRLAAERERKVYQTADHEIDKVIDQYRQFVTLCEKVEARTGKPPTIIASW